MKQIRYTNRSGQNQFQRCPRAGYLGQFLPRNGKPVGIDLKGKPFQMLAGIYIHEGIASLLSGKPVDDAVNDALMRLDGEVDWDGVMTYGCEPQQVRQELEMHVEGLIRGWAIKRLPYFLNEFEILELETDHSLPFASSEIEDVEFEFKPDAVLKHKTTGLIYILSLKTTSTAGANDSRKSGDAESDVQGLSEIWGVEEWSGLSVNGVIMEYILTGKKDITENEFTKSKTWTQFNPLIRGWKDQATGQIAWRYQWEQLNEDTGEVQTKRLGKKFQRINALEYGGVKEWVDLLASGGMFPNTSEYSDPLREVFVSIEYYRRPEDIEEWLESTKAQEIRVSKSIARVNDATEGNFTSRLREEFPMYRHSCNYPVKCQFFEICHGSAGLDPFMNGFKWRESHHKNQLESSRE